jgi:molybdopterin-guanine dinucleotide biosynthesis protein A
VSTPASAVAAVVLAGGAARRFGSDKTRASLDSTTLLEHVIDAVEPLVDDLLVVGPWAPAGHRHLAEPARLQGPLAACEFGLRQVTGAHALVLAADHPRIQPDLLRLLLDRRLSADAVVPRRAGIAEPLVGCYRTATAGVAERLLASGERSLRSLLDEIDTAWIEEGEWRAVDPEGLSFLDIDHPADLERLAAGDTSPGETVERAR